MSSFDLFNGAVSFENSTEHENYLSEKDKQLLNKEKELVEKEDELKEKEKKLINREQDFKQREKGLCLYEVKIHKTEERIFFRERLLEQLKVKFEEELTIAAEKQRVVEEEEKKLLDNLIERNILRMENENLRNELEELKKEPTLKRKAGIVFDETNRCCWEIKKVHYEEI